LWAMGAPELTTAEDFRLRTIAVSAYGPTVVAAVGAGAMAPVVALSALALGASQPVAALTAGLTLVAELFFAVPAGAMVHRIGERRALLWACVVDAAGNIATKAFYSNYQYYDDIPFPTTIVIQRPQDHYGLTVTITKLTLNQKMDDDQFELKIPEGYPIQQMN